MIFFFQLEMLYVWGALSISLWSPKGFFHGRMRSPWCLRMPSCYTPLHTMHRQQENAPETGFGMWMLLERTPIW